MRHIVPAAGEGKRASGWSRQGAWPSRLQSKKQALQAFKEGRLLLGSAVVEETRVLRCGDVLSLLHDKGGAARAQAAGKREAPVLVYGVEAEWAAVFTEHGVWHNFVPVCHWHEAFQVTICFFVFRV